MTKHSLETGVALAARLVRQESRRALQQQFCVQLQRLFALHGAWCLDLDLSGRSLTLEQGDGTLEFACDDFSHPFALVVRDRSTRLIDRAAQLRQDHGPFRSWIDGLPAGSALLLTPVTTDQRLLGAVALAGPRELVSALSETAMVSDLTDLLGVQWGRHLEAAERLDRQRWLKRSLDGLQTGARNRSRADSLSRELVGESAPMIQLREQIVRAANSSMAVLVQAETGCGKDLVASAIHRFSSRAEKPFVVLNCAAIPESLLESELFGHRKGAFSGADSDKVGLLEQADGGTLFLDEIGDMPLNLQSKLLRVLETQRFRPVGAQQEIASDFRLVAATHQPLRQRIEEGRFRQDLFFRLSQFPLNIVPLRERLDDLERISRHLITIFREREGRGPGGISTAALRRLKEYDFPGNVRELRNLLEFACIQTTPGEDIQPEDLPLTQMTTVMSTELKGSEGTGSEEVDDESLDVPSAHEIHDLRAATQAFEASIINARLRQFDGNRARAAASLGLPKRTLAHKCLKLNLDG